MGWKKNDMVQIEITDMSDTGEGIGKTDGFTWFVKDAVIGDVVEASVMKLKKTYGFARLQKILEPSPVRVTPACPVARQCGGCQLQALRYDEQLRFKENKVRSNLRRIGGFENFVFYPIIGMDNPWRYRNKAQFPFGKSKDGRIITGFYAARTHAIIEQDDCLLGAEENAAILKCLKSYMEQYHISPYDETTHTGLVRHALIRKGFATGELMVCLVINGSAHDLKNSGELVKSLKALYPGPEPMPESKNGAEEMGYRGTEEGRKVERYGAAEDVDAGECGGVAESTSEEDGKAEKFEDVGMIECVAAEGYDAAAECGAATRYREKAEHGEAVYAWKGWRDKKPVPRMASISVSINREQTNVIMGTEIVHLYGPGYITDYIGNVCYRISPLSFYQVNPVQTERLYGTALEYAGLTGTETVWDLYCGIGTISLFLAQKAKNVYGVEIIPQAIEDARANAALNGMDNVEFFVGKAEEVLPEQYEKNHIYADVIVVDPPRKGCDQVCLDTILKMAPQRIVYVSCDSATLARDLKYLCAEKYTLEKVRTVDMFGNSGHVETIVKLVRK